MALSSGPDEVHVRLEGKLVSVRVEYGSTGRVAFELPEEIAKLLPSAMMSAFAAQAFMPEEEQQPTDEARE